MENYKIKLLVTVFSAAMVFGEKKFKYTDGDVICTAESAEKCIAQFVGGIMSGDLCQSLQHNIECISKAAQKCQGEAKTLLRLEMLLAHKPLLFHSEFPCRDLDLTELDLAIPEEFYPTSLMDHIEQLNDESKLCLFGIFSAGQQQAINIEVEDLTDKDPRRNNLCQHMDKLDRATMKALRRCDTEFAEYFIQLNLQLSKFVQRLNRLDPSKCHGNTIAENARAEL